MNKEKYSDPTAEQAIANVMRKEKKNRETRRKMRRVTRTQTGRVRVRI